ncbi:MAG: hypothetical protein K9J12_08935 [Melioribacteraceae bacterium]|nr:hypothetical protein [Melioribacteraceae bacterium]MCF8266256.1 hypothetical protein [Melioribacteraceae bacterium]MCF8411956.1 hypothetical protein [Melioribacteraceae bacterium]
MAVADFDSKDPRPPIDLIKLAEHYELPVYLEKSESKGFHVWMFFDREGVSAKKINIVLQYLLGELNLKHIEIFPKQDQIINNKQFGNFINTPLFGKYQNDSKTKFVKPTINTPVIENQWQFLKSIKRNTQKQIDEIIAINELGDQNPYPKKHPESKKTYGLPPCMQKILENGVTQNQRIACFRLATALKKTGLSEEHSLKILIQWSHKNKPQNRQRIISTNEIIEQTEWGYKPKYNSYGCEDEVIKSFCSSECNIQRKFD